MILSTLKNLSGEHKEIIRLVKGQIITFVLILVFVVLGSIMGLCTPMLFRLIIDKVLLRQEFHLFKSTIFVLVFGFLVNILIGFVTGYLSTHITQVTSFRMKRTLLRRIFDADPEEIMYQSSGELINKITGDVSTIANFLGVTLISVLTSFLNLLAILTFMVFLNFKLSIVAFLIMVAQVLVSAKYSEPIRKYYQSMREVIGSHLGFTKTVLNGLVPIKLYQMDIPKEREHVTLLRKALDISFVQYFVGFRHSVALNAVSFAGSLIIFIIGVYEIYRGNLTIGSLFVFDTIFERFKYFSGNIVALNASIQGVLVSANRVNSVYKLNGENIVGSAQKSVAFGQPIVLEKVWFTRDKQDILRNFTYEFLPSKVYTIVGGSGHGKTTLAKLMVGLYRPSSGRILLNGVEQKNLNSRLLRRTVTLVPQDEEILGETIEDVLLCGIPKVTEERLQKALKLSSSYDFICQSENGIKTRIDEEGRRLSGGQKQRLRIAKALLRDSSIYIFDESLSNLDKQMEEQIFWNIQRALKGRTIIYITHNIMLTRYVKNIIVMNEGCIEASGDHDFLFKNSMKYRSLLRGVS